jgi:hypothetical protein
MGHVELAIGDDLFDQQMIGTADANTREIHPARIGSDVADEILQRTSLAPGSVQQSRGGNTHRWAGHR